MTPPASGETEPAGPEPAGAEPDRPEPPGPEPPGPELASETRPELAGVPTFVLTGTAWGREVMSHQSVTATATRTATPTAAAPRRPGSHRNPSPGRGSATVTAPSSSRTRPATRARSPGPEPPVMPTGRTLGRVGQPRCRLRRAVRTGTGCGRRDGFRHRVVLSARVRHRANRAPAASAAPVVPTATASTTPADA